MITPHNSSYIAMHLDRLDDELLSDTYGKQIEDTTQKKCSCECGCTRTISNLNNEFCKFCILGTHKRQENIVTS